jgi:hypothetical protein
METDQAFVRLYSNTETACEITAYEASGNAWAEEDITWNNAPSIGPAVATARIETEKKYYDWDVTDYVRNNLGDSITLVFFDASASNNEIHFSSREGENPPELKLTELSTEYKFLPAIPTPLFASAVSSSEIDLSWIDHSVNEEGFILEKKQGGAFTEIATVGKNIVSYRESGLESSATYIYRVRAYNAEGKSDYSNEASAETFTDQYVTTTFGVTEDAYVRGGNYSEENYGTATDLRVKRGSVENYFRKTLVKFDLSSVDLADATIGKSVLRLFANKAEECTIIASEIDDNWTEAGVTWATAPVSGSEIAPSEISNIETYYEWDISAYLKAQIEQDGVVSVCLEEHTGANANVIFNSREAGSKRPELVFITDKAINTAYQNTINKYYINVYPNPVTAILHIESGASRINRLAVYNLTGQLIQVVEMNGNQMHIPVGHYKAGVYLIKAEGDFGTYIKKFIKTQ